MARTRALSPAARIVLSILLDAKDDWSHGYALAKSANIKSGTLYPLLIRLEQQGYLEAQWQPQHEAGRPPRHAYRLTTTGVQLAHANPPQQSCVAPTSETVMA
jgi:PadR family transcriptional regulator, regulatory protein PadR